ncbi:MAG TPA: hypothetical protein VF475_04330 [Sphingobium sp.]
MNRRAVFLTAAAAPVAATAAGLSLSREGGRGAWVCPPLTESGLRPFSPY